MSTVQTASERLTLSRARLRDALQDMSVPAQEVPQPRGNWSGSAWLDLLKSIPGVGVVVDAISRWWSQHPLHFAGMAAADAAKAMLQPVAQRNPLGLTVGALLLGGLFAWSRSWRWIVKLTLFAGLVPQLVIKVLTHVPSGLWMTMWDAWAQERHTPHRALAERGVARQIGPNRSRAADATGAPLDTARPNAPFNPVFKKEGPHEQRETS